MGRGLKIVVNSEEHAVEEVMSIETFHFDKIISWKVKQYFTHVMS